MFYNLPNQSLTEVRNLFRYSGAKHIEKTKSAIRASELFLNVNFIYVPKLFNPIITTTFQRIFLKNRTIVLFLLIVF